MQMHFQLTALCLPLLLLTANSIVFLSAAPQPNAPPPSILCPKGTKLNAERMLQFCGTPTRCPAVESYCQMAGCCDPACPSGFTVGSGSFNNTGLTWCQPDGSCPYSPSAKCIDTVCCTKQ